MTQWLYRYVFRGIGIVFLAVILTILYLTISYLSRPSTTSPAASPAAPGSGGRR